eukprot:Mrub_05123.p1 GENE.Mrub_05123~~Mrub_05123.p1  ORF type:complete len:386 (+),score=29.01 Mrub_05123:22-1158(+)
MIDYFKIEKDKQLHSALSDSIYLANIFQEFNKYKFDFEKNVMHGFSEFDKTYNSLGFNIFGYNKDGYDTQGFNYDGYNKFGFDYNGFNKFGFNVDGIDKSGLDKYGYKIINGVKIKTYNIEFGYFVPDEKIKNFVKLISTKYANLLNTGKFRNVYSGKISEGRIIKYLRKDSHIVVKTFNEERTNKGYIHTIIDEEMQDKAIELSKLFLEYLKPDKLKIYFRKSKLIFLEDDILDSENKIVIKKDLPVMIEKMIHRDYQKFNSNTGWSNGTEILDAFSHWTYAFHGKLVCDLQGHKGRHAQYYYSKKLDKYNSIYYLLTDPCIHTFNNQYGHSDLGNDGIRNFFYYHKCNQYCKDWKLPNDIEKIYVAEESTSFAKHD